MSRNVFPAGDFLRPKEAAVVLGCSRQTVGRLVEDGELKAVQLRGWWRISQQSLERYIERLKNQSRRRK